MCERHNQLVITGRVFFVRRSFICLLIHLHKANATHTMSATTEPTDVAALLSLSVTTVDEANVVIVVVSAAVVVVVVVVVIGMPSKKFPHAVSKKTTNKHTRTHP